MADKAANGRGQFGPGVYAEWRASSLGEIVEELEHRLILRLAGPLPGRRVLDAGCGDGTLGLVFTAHGAARVAGCDGDARMVARARQAAAAQHATLELAVSRCEALPYADASFDLATCITVLAFVPDPAQALAELARVLRPGGRLIIGDLNRWSVWAARRRIRGWLGARPWQQARFRTAGELAAMLRAAGLVPKETAGAIFFPPWTGAARRMAPLDARLGGLTTAGAAFVAIRADKPG